MALNSLLLSSTNCPNWANLAAHHGEVVVAVQFADLPDPFQPLLVPELAPECET